MKRRAVILTMLAGIVPVFPIDAPGQEAAPSGRKVVKTDQEWQNLLTRPQYLVTRKKATEPPFSGKYATGHPKGTFACVCCGAGLFSARTKFNSGTGWPSFYAPITPRSVETAMDYSSGESRVEVMCVDCGAHLGHVFDDGPPPTGLRYCINSLALKLVPDPRATPAPKKARGKGEKPSEPDPDPAASEKEKGADR